MDTGQGLVAISGTVDPQLVIRKFEKWGKKAIPWSPQNASANANSNAYFNQKNNAQHAKIDQECCHEDDSDSNSDSDSDDDYDHNCNQHESKGHNGTVSWQHPDLLKKPAANVSTNKGKKPCCFLSLFCKKGGAQKPNIMPVVGNKFSPRRPMPEYRAPRPYYPAYGERPHYGSQYYRPLVHGRPAVLPYPHYQAMYPPPQPIPYGFSRSRPLQPFNPMIHYTRYEDNYI